MTQCSDIFGNCEANATYTPDNEMSCLQYCTPKPCPSNVNNIFSDCTQYVTNKNVFSGTGLPSISPECLDAFDDGITKIPTFCPAGITQSSSITGINLLAPISAQNEFDAEVIKPYAVCSSASPQVAVHGGRTLKNICTVSYTGTTSPIFQQNVDHACSSEAPYPVTSTLYPPCSPDLNKVWTKCNNEFGATLSSSATISLSPTCRNLKEDNWLTLRPVANKPPTYCAYNQSGPIDLLAMVNEATGEYIGNEFVCTTQKPSAPPCTTCKTCLAQYNDQPSTDFCKKFGPPPTTTRPPPTTTRPPSNNKLSTGAIVGIVIASLAVLMILIIILTRKKRKKKSRK